MERIDRLNGVAGILERSNQEIATALMDNTGFVPAEPKKLILAVLKVLEHTDSSSVSLDLGCGNGTWALLMVATGRASYGIEINPYLFDHAQRNYQQAVKLGFIDASTPFKLVLGDMIPVNKTLEYDAYRKEHTAHLENMPIGAVAHNTYRELPILLATADIIYCWAWPTQSRFLFNMLQTEAKGSAVFVLPSYLRYIKSDLLIDFEPNTLNLTPLLKEGENYVGVRDT